MGLFLDFFFGSNTGVVRCFRGVRLFRSRISRGAWGRWVYPGVMRGRVLVRGSGDLFLPAVGPRGVGVVLGWGGY